MPLLSKRHVATVGALAAALLLAAPPARAQQRGVLRAPVKVGEVAPDFSLPASDGRTHHLAEARDARRVVLVLFRGSW